MLEKHPKTKTSYRVSVTMEDGTTKTFNYAAQTSYKVGDQVKVVNNKLTRQQ